MHDPILYISGEEKISAQPHILLYMQILLVIH